MPCIFLGMSASEVKSGLEVVCWGDSLQLYRSFSQPDVSKASWLCFLSRCGETDVRPSSSLSLPPSHHPYLLKDFSLVPSKLLQTLRTGSGGLPFIYCPSLRFTCDFDRREV